MTALSVCPHCNSPASSDAAYHPYCCVGCKAAHGLLQSAGLLNFYALRGATRLSAVGSRGEKRERLWLTPLLDQAESKAADAELVALRLDVQGLECAACVWLLEKLFLKKPGAARIMVNPAVGRIELLYRRTQHGRQTVEQFVDDVEALGYRLGPARKDGDAKVDDLVLRLGLSAALSMNSMIFAFSTYFGLSQREEPIIYKLFGYGGLALGTATVLIGGTVFFRSAVQAISRGILHMDVPIALGILLTYVGSVWSFFAGEGRASYFDTLCIFITLMLLGRLLQRRLASHNRQRLLADDTVSGLLVRTIRTGTDGTSRLEILPASQIQKDQVLLCAPGELLPVQATLLDGTAEFSLDWIMGESTPKQYAEKQAIPAGAHNRGKEAVRLSADEAFSASRLRDLLCAPSVEKPLPGDVAASGQRADFWDYLSRYYVSLVLLLATTAFALWFRSGVLRATEVAVAVLVVTCPCALGIATPLAYELAQARLRRRGLFVRTPSFFDRALGLRKVLLDKTGTVTLSELTLANKAPLHGLSSEQRQALFQMVARSNHPVSRAILSAISQLGIEDGIDATAQVEEHAGLGLSLGRFGHTYRLGTPRFVLPTDADSQADSQSDSDSSEPQSVFGCDGVPLARFSLSEALCRDAASEVSALKAQGLSLFILSGDRQDKVSRIGRQLGICDAFGGLSPEQKCAMVKQIDDGHGDTLMIGDGINDALAFSAAACAGTPAIDRPTLPARADFYFSGVGIGPISEALKTAKALRRTILRNLGLSSFYNLIVLSLSFAGLMTPLRCALAMPLSSLVVIFATVRSLRDKDEATDQNIPHAPDEKSSETESPLLLGVSS
ncbi:MAG: HAD-IC family P-type ATPase [Polyangia bacterium]